MPLELVMSLNKIDLQPKDKRRKQRLPHAILHTYWLNQGASTPAPLSGSLISPSKVCDALVLSTRIATQEFRELPILQLHWLTEMLILVQYGKCRNETKAAQGNNTYVRVVLQYVVQMYIFVQICLVLVIYALSRLLQVRRLQQISGRQAQTQ